LKKLPSIGFFSHRWRDSSDVLQPVENMTFSYRLSDSLSLGPHLAVGSILLSAGALIHTISHPLWPTSEMNRALSFLKLAVIGRKFQISETCCSHSFDLIPTINVKVHFIHSRLVLTSKFQKYATIGKAWVFTQLN
jgi:hypothetical protein